MNSSESQLVELCSLLYPKQCCHEVLTDLLFTKQCISVLVSKSLGYGIIAGSTLVKLPQFLKIWSARSGEGISLIGVVLELLAMTFSASYAFANNFPFSAWGECLFLMLVTTGIAYLVLKYQQNLVKAFTFVTIYMGLTYVLMSGLTPLSILWSLQAANLPLAISGKMFQAFINYSNGNTGQLSAISATLLFLGSFARIFTSIQETGDQLVVITFTVASIANFILLTQIIYYWNKTNEFIQRKTLEKKKI
ncbi:mannose-P-dolichol utilization defect 1 protein-like [Oppia nitens]|uniref:mannose-P-dolichol utilization defect 1 protein-like n=1 Tax=Oppia nitens TaxID=1686743 RepID=UPI0023DCE3E8|nr:mannose-P-dolichol utilization defect 1 protein-like [Oppia nitens]